MPRILVIETEASLRAVIGQSLTGSGHEILEAPNGEEGLRVWHARGADLVVAEVLMPGTSGVAVILELHTFAPGLPIIALVGGEQTRELGMLADANLLGAVGLLQKPFSLGELLLAVSAALPAEPPGTHVRTA
jgi:CheY-like chemotaxis protein